MMVNPPPPHQKKIGQKTQRDRKADLAADRK